MVVDGMLILNLIVFAPIILAEVYSPKGKVVGGYEVGPKFKYGWLASLAHKGKHQCGGILINSRTVISAAHCVFGQTSDWVARFHRHNLSLTTEQEKGRESAVTKRIKHPKFNFGGNDENDVAIWKVHTTVDSFIFYDLGILTNRDTLLYVAGWGTTGFGKAASPILLEVKVPVYDTSKCKIPYPGLDPTSQFCAGYPEGGRDACQGDSGGPIFHKSSLGYFLVGVVSYGEGCAEKGFPGVYTRLSAALPFILSNSY